MSDYREQAAIKLRGIFEQLSKELPDRLSGTEPLGLGGQAIVVDHLDGTVSKFFFKDDVFGIDGFTNEVDVLRLVSGNVFGQAKAPELVDVAIIDDSNIAFGAYRMTKLIGNEMNWQEFSQSETPSSIERHFREAGALLAEFHTKMQSVLGSRQVPERSFQWGNTIEEVLASDEAVNGALRIGKNYFESRVQSGVNHGDFHSGNIRVDEDFKITGLFDFSFAGKAPNHLMDFAMMPDEGAAHALKEYGMATGKIIDPNMMALTQLSISTATINYWATQPEGDGPAWIHDQFRKRLDGLSHITGFSFV